MGVKDRLIEFINYLGLGKSNFEKSIDKSNGFVDKVTDNIRPTSVKAITEAYPILNKEWLLTGNGNMLNSEETPIKEASLFIKEEEYSYEVPLVPLHAYAGTLSTFTEGGAKYQDCEIIKSPIPADCAVQVDGDSMEPYYPDKSLVLVKQYYPDAFIEWGRIYVLCTCNGIVIKKVDKSEIEGCIRCVSLNPEYADFDVERNHIQGWYRVLKGLTIK